MPRMSMRAYGIMSRKKRERRDSDIVINELQRDGVRREETDQGWISRKVLKHGISLVLRYVLCSYISLFYL